MKELAFRLTEGEDLKKSLVDKCSTIDTAIVLSCVGSLSNINLRLAGAKEYLIVQKDFEIVSITGTISRGKVHIHMSVADERGNVYGGHLKEGCIVNTTAEIVLGILDNYKSERVFDSQTNYEEIVFREVIDD